MLVFYSGWGYWEHITLDQNGVEQITREDAGEVSCFFKLPIKAELEATYIGETTTSYLYLSEQQPKGVSDSGPLGTLNDEVGLLFVLCDEPTDFETVYLPQRDNENPRFRQIPISTNEKTIRITKDKLISELTTDNLFKDAIEAKAITFPAGINEEDVADNQADTKTNEGVLTKLEKQQRAILTVIQIKQFEPQAIPDGEKGTIKQICESDYPELFHGTTSFDNAWKASKSLFRMANHASYAKRGKA